MGIRRFYISLFGRIILVKETDARRKAKQQGSIMKLFIADDNVRYRQRLVSILSQLDGITIAGEAGDVAEAIDSIKKTRPDVMMLDIHMPGGSGLDVLQAAKTIEPAPVIIMLTVGPGSEYRNKCLAMGADYFFEKSSGLKKITLILMKMVHESKVSDINPNASKAQKTSRVS